jgi:hypothetical protein
MIDFCGRLAGLMAATMLAGCSALPVAVPDIGSSPWAIASSRPGGSPSAKASPWRHHTFPGKSPTRFNYMREDGRDVVAVMAASSASMLRSVVRIEPAELGSVRFSWKVPELISGADMAARDADDSPVRVVLFFEGDRSRLSPRDAMMAELVRAVTGEDMPYATLMYVWCNRRASGALITNPRTDRIRTLVVESGAGRLNQWLQYERDIAADFRRAFGEEPGALTGMAIMTDSDNTQSMARAWYGPLRLLPPTARK